MNRMFPARHGSVADAILRHVAWAHAMVAGPAAPAAAAAETPRKHDYAALWRDEGENGGA
jgi:hypothetical protein